MDDVGIESANIFGVSEGGSMACLFAATYPQRVDSLLIWGAQARWIACDDHPWAQTRQIVTLGEDRAGILHVRIKHRFEEIVAQIVMHAPTFRARRIVC